MVERFPKIPKVKEPVTIALMDGTVLDGHMFIDATSRIQDVLNGESQFFPFLTDAGGQIEIAIINKAAVKTVRPKHQDDDPAAKVR
ncbi:MAG: hypothetical protein U1E97_12865 [Alphaproteobacteria bacterium]